MNDNNNFPKGLETIYSHAKKLKHSTPPVESWNPDYCGEIDINLFISGRLISNCIEIKDPKEKPATQH